MATGLQEIVVAKGTSMIVLGGAAFIVTLLPVLLNRFIAAKKPLEVNSSRSDFILSLFMSFGGGVLLCTTFLHLLPEVGENIEDLKKEGRIPEDFPLPLAEFVMCCGFFTMYIIEEVVHKCLHSRKKKNLKGCDNPFIVASAVLVDSEVTMTDSYKNILKQDGLNVTFSSPHEEDIKIFPGKNGQNYGSSCIANVEVNHNHDPHFDHDHQPHHHREVHLHHDHDHVVVTDAPPSLRELLLVLALTVHEGFEGLAIGLESSVAAVWYLLAAVAVHKCVIAFCIGVELVSSHTSIALSVFYAFIYSCASPFGIGIGLVLSSASADNSFTVLLSVALQGMATGTLLYVVFFEILRREGHTQKGLSQLVAVIVGFAAMATVTVGIDA